MKSHNVLLTTVLIFVALVLLSFLFIGCESKTIEQQEQEIRQRKYPKGKQYVILVSDKTNWYYGIYDKTERNWSRKREPDTCAFNRRKADDLMQSLSIENCGMIFTLCPLENFNEYLKDFRK
jgi:hypothetical protein